MKKFLYLTAAILMFASCQREPNQGNELDKNNPRTEILLSKGGEAMVNNGNEFTLNLFKELSKRDEGNLLINGLSVNSTMSLLLNGLDGEVADGLKVILNYGDLSNEEVNENYKLLIDGLLNADKTTSLAIANSFWLSSHWKYTLNEDFKSIAENSYNSYVGLVDLTNPNSYGQIGKWIAEKTNNMISDFEIKPNYNSNSVMLNVMSFEGRWRSQFDKEKTIAKVFYNHDEHQDQVLAKMMRGEITGDVYKTEDYNIAWLPFGNGTYFMCVILPIQKGKLDEVIAKYNNSEYSMISKYITLSDSKFHIEMPKFELEKEVDLIEAMKSLGVDERLFDKKQALSFDKIATSELQTRFYISQYSQRNKIKIDEEGAKVVTVTKEVKDGISTDPGPNPDRYLKLDRPFMYMIVEASTKTILYVGKITEL